MKIILLLSLVTYGAAQLGLSPVLLCKPKDCPDTLDVVWSSDGKKCYFSQNDCFYYNLHCQHLAKRNVVYIVTHEDCKHLCNYPCPLGGRRVCVREGGALRAFHNDCALENYICNTGKVALLNTKEYCPLYGIGLST